MERKFRIAPTPSGFLHRGNALNFVLTWGLARSSGSKLWLRIDDSDQTRVRDQYLENIFETLEWLGLDWDEGPKSVDDFKKNHSQSLKTDYYFSELEKVKDLFSCECSRSQLKGHSAYPGTCLEKNLPLKRGEFAFRKLTSSDWKISDEFKHCVLWRKDDLPAYQWVSLIEDRDQLVTDLVRGEDLFESTRFQKALANDLNFSFPKNILHHELLEIEGEKISKSQKASSLFEEFSSPGEFYQTIITDFLDAEEPIFSSSGVLKFYARSNKKTCKVRLS